MLWKDSLDFIRIVKQKNVDAGAMSLEERVEQIVVEHGRDAAIMQNQDAYGIEQNNNHHLSVNYFDRGGGPNAPYSNF